MDEIMEMKIKGYTKTANAYLEKISLNDKEKELLEDIFYNLWDIPERELSKEIKKLRLNTIEKIALKRGLI